MSTMNAQTFAAYVTEELKKALTMPAAEAQARVVQLAEQVSKATWESTEAGPRIEMYQTPDVSSKTEQSSKEMPLLSNIGSGTQGNTSFAAPEGAQSFAKSLADLNATIAAALAPAPGEVAQAAQRPEQFWPRDVNQTAFLRDGVTKRTSVEDDDWGADPRPR